MASTSGSMMAKPGPSAPNSGMTVRMMAATAASSAGRIGRMARRRRAGVPVAEVVGRAAHVAASAAVVDVVARVDARAVAADEAHRALNGADLAGVARAREVGGRAAVAVRRQR